MTDRQKDLYNFIASHIKVTQRQIYDNVSGYTWNYNRHSHDRCPAIWHDIMAINKEHSKPIIIMKNFEYWIGTKQETKEFLAELWLRIVPKLHRYWKLVKKAKRNGQVEIDFDEYVETVYKAWRTKNHEDEEF